mgnify:CR=1 FL=1
MNLKKALMIPFSMKIAERNLSKKRIEVIMKLFHKTAHTAILMLTLACGCSLPTIAAEADKEIVDSKKQSAQIVQEGLLMKIRCQIDCIYHRISMTDSTDPRNPR